MLKFFRKRRPAHRAEPAPSRGDIQTAYAWGLTLADWNSLTDFERAECRRNVTTAPRFTP
jgi:hypothetical protein